jgi:hypothetical protein
MLSGIQKRTRKQKINQTALRGLYLNFYLMKKAIKITGKILYFILAMSPIFALGYMLGLKLL